MAKVYKISVTQVRVRGVKVWQVRWTREGRPMRCYPGSKLAAQAKAAALRGEQLNTSEQWAAMNTTDRERLMAVWQESQRKGWDLFDLLAKGGEIMKQNASPAIEDVLAEMVAAKKEAGKDADYLKSLKQVAKMFYKGRARRAINLFSLDDVLGFLRTKKLASRSTLRARLSTLFKYARRHKYRADNPCADLEPVRVLKKLPVIFTPEQAATCVEYIKEHPKCAGWFLLTCFAGLRPEEAMLCGPGNLHLEAAQPFLEVTPEICKTGQWRIVYLRPDVTAALKWALKAGAKLPLTLKNKRVFQVRLRNKLELKRWPQDVTRHSAASYWLAVTDDAKLVAKNLGHSERELNEHYKRPQTREHGEAFFKALGPLI